ncbi:Enhancing lycopene biosynthesis protein 2 [hydrothermal vent metagenome]|uniref:Enhancing lycopene biosynthesis protein 2 n=1 Tax=hydrothermal vent metagenome TaxID=652676 RepID=A0A3B1B0I6_9ZZZZ
MAKPNVAVILSGCGVFDGTEIHESVLSLLAIDRQGAAYQCFAPDILQRHVINHISGNEMAESRNVLIESARIARGNVKALAEFDAAEFDVLLMPGGFGAAKNLSSLAFDGPECSVNDDLVSAVTAMVKVGKPIGALCIAPAILARILDGVKITIGNDPDTIGAIEAMGGNHQETSHGEVVVDERLKLVTSPCYMLDTAPISQIAEGADNCVRELLRLV